MSEMPQVLIVDDEPDIRELLEITLQRMQLETSSAADIAEAKIKLANQRFDLCLTDMKLPDGNGLELIKHIQKECPETPVAMITAFGSVDIAINALKEGAFDFVNKPLDLERLRSLVQTALQLGQREGGVESKLENELLGQSSSVIELRKKISKLSRSEAPVYIAGESGSGKELVARLIHSSGPRADGPFIPVNCGAIPSELMESEFFGHIKGSFTGAIANKQGLFEAAQGGTLFLDEVADLPLAMQVKLLRAIQEKAVKPVGAAEEKSIDVRILSATHKDLAMEIQQERFRQDLYYRINVIELRVPGLRERPGDIRLLSEHFLKKASSGSNPVTISEDAYHLLEQHDFPGNIRELENTIERALTLCENNRIEAHDLQLRTVASVPAATENTSSAPPQTEETGLYPAVDLDQEISSLEDFLENIERQVIERALVACRWNKTAAAEKLGISFRALRYRLKKLDMQ
jgi:two-component system response regulator PilR (NtrC family)